MKLKNVAVASLIGVVVGLIMLTIINIIDVFVDYYEHNNNDFDVVYVTVSESYFVGNSMKKTSDKETICKPDSSSEIYINETYSVSVCEPVTQSSCDEDTKCEETTELEEVKCVETKETHNETDAAIEVTTINEDMTEVVHAPSYTVSGNELSQDLRDYYYNELVYLGIPYWYEIGLCQMFQESQYNYSVRVLNNGYYDVGILQFREAYWPSMCEEYGLPGADICDPYAQIYIYTRRVQKDIFSGMSTNNVISNHFTNGVYYDDCYVNNVLRWLYVR